MAYTGAIFNARNKHTEITAEMLEENLKENGNDVNVSDHDEETLLIHFKTGHEYIVDKSGNIIVNWKKIMNKMKKILIYLYTM